MASASGESPSMKVKPYSASVVGSASQRRSAYSMSLGGDGTALGLGELREGLLGDLGQLVHVHVLAVDPPRVRWPWRTLRAHRAPRLIHVTGPPGRCWLQYGSPGTASLRHGRPAFVGASQSRLPAAKRSRALASSRSSLTLASRVSASARRSAGVRSSVMTPPPSGRRRPPCCSARPHRAPVAHPCHPRPSCACRASA